MRELSRLNSQSQEDPQADQSERLIMPIKKVIIQVTSELKSSAQDEPAHLKRPPINFG